jgi:hypothetical protein
VTAVADAIDLRLPLLHDAQQQIEREARKYNALCAGRRFGKNEAMVSRVLDGSPQQRNGVLDGFSWGWFAPTYKILDDSWRVFSRLFDQIPGAYVNQSKYYAKLPTGGVLECWSFEGGDDVGRSREYSGGIVVDEAAMVQRLQAIYDDSLSALTVKFPTAQIWFTSTPKGVINDFHTYYQKGQGLDPEWASWRFPTTANPHIPASEIEKKRREMPDHSFRQEYLAEFIDEGVHPIGMTHIAACTRPVSEGEPVVWGVDLARSVDYTVALALDISGTICRAERWQTPWGVTRSRLNAILGPVVSYVDSTGVGDPIVEDLQRSGRQVVPMVFTARLKQQMVEGLIAGIQQHRVGFPDGWLRKELEQLQAERIGATVRYRAPQGLHDDGAMALALAWHGYTALGFSGLLKESTDASSHDPDRHPGYDPETHQRIRVNRGQAWPTTGAGTPLRPRTPYKAGWK